ncbi:MAG: prenyltransferase [Agarilytica sp.]
MAVATLIQSIRPPFLLLTPICVLLGFAASSAQWNSLLFSLVCVGALFAHVSVNALNEYFDFKSGLDLNTTKTPFSGGSGALPADPASARKVLALGIVSLCCAIALGCYLVWLSGTELLIFGVLGILLVVLYTPWINRNAMICLVAPGLGFGTFMVLGAAWVFAKNVSVEAMAASLVPFFLVNNLLLLNQFPDLEADKAAGRKHLIIRYGVSVGVKVYALFLCLAGLSVLVAVVLQIFPPFSLLCLVFLLPAINTWINLKRLHADIGSEEKYLAMNVVSALSVPAILATTLLLAGCGG